MRWTTRYRVAWLSTFVWLIEEIERRFYYRFRDLGPVEIDAYRDEVTKAGYRFWCC